MFIIRLGFQIVNIKLEIFIKNFSMIYSYIYIQAGQPPATYKGVFIMHDFNFEMNQYLTYCRTQKRLDGKTLKAYRIDLTQFGVSLAAAFPSAYSISDISPAILESYVASLHEQFKPKTVKRKLASLKAFFHYLDYRDRIVSNPFNKLHIKFREPVILPKTIPLPTIELLLSSIYHQYSHAATDFQRKMRSGMLLLSSCSSPPASESLSCVPSHRMTSTFPTGLCLSSAKVPKSGSSRLAMTMLSIPCWNTGNVTFLILSVPTASSSTRQDARSPTSMSVEPSGNTAVYLPLICTSLRICSATPLLPAS